MTHRIRKFIGLPGSERRLLAAAVIALVKARLAVRLVPFRQLLEPIKPQVQASPSNMDAATVGWAIETISAIVPGLRNCLVRAIAGRALLARHGHASRICIGVGKNSTKSFRAHAWLQSGDRIVTGEGEHRDFIPLPLESRVVLDKGNNHPEGRG